MGNPVRFYGSGQPIELEEGGTLPANCSVEVTFRTYEERFFMRPSPAVNETILGCFGRAQRRYPTLKIHVVSFLSDHGSFVCTPPNPMVLWSFMRDFLSTAGRRLNRQLGRKGVFWERRYRAIPIVDEESLERCFAYCLLQGTKENLVADVREWPGVNSVRALTEDAPLVGRWRDHRREYELCRQRRRKLDRAAARGWHVELPPVPEQVDEIHVELAPLPHWEGLDPQVRRARVTEIVDADAATTTARHERDGTRPLGVARLLEVSPFDRPAEPKRSPAPRCHASSPARRTGFDGAYRRHVDGMRGVVVRLEPELRRLGCPVGTSLPPLCRGPSAASTTE